MISSIHNLFAPKPAPVLAVPDLPERIRPFVKPFGSRIWGGATAQSDIDLLANTKDLNEFAKILDSYFIEYRTSSLIYSMMNYKITFTYESIPIDVSFTSNPSLFTAVDIATAYLKTCKPTEYCDRNFRIEVFERLVKICKGDFVGSHPIYKFVQLHNPELLV